MPGLENYGCNRESRGDVFMTSPADILRTRNALMPSYTTEELYHGSNVEFDRFVFTGQKLPALGYGHYLTPDIEKAAQYGSVIMAFSVKANVLDWAALDTLERAAIEQLLLDCVPKERRAGFSTPKQMVFPSDKIVEARVFYGRQRELTKEYWHDRAKANVLPHPEGFLIEWREGDDLAMANNEQLLNLAQEYRHEIARELGYQGARFGNELVIYSADYAQKLSVLPVQDKPREVISAVPAEQATPATKMRMA
ncbi:hypothetical protein D3C80_176320 [compost metagenome]